MSPEPLPTRLVLVRHGETDLNLEDRWQGSASDAPLNDTGRDQIRTLAERLASASVELAALYTSDLLRARESAEILARRLDLSLRVDPALREMDHGAFEGLTKKEAMELFPGAHAALEADPGRVPRPGGDSYGTLGERLWPALDRIVHRHPGERVGIVAHGGPIRLVLSRALERPLTERAEFGVTNGSWFVVEVAGDRWRVADG
ncbi:MAG TPA: histidine phosphatase family protein [Gemmatimonadota bacterium]|nr:histidine phosphatase family protein [Gemmatimonadota bacterium]